MLPVSSSTVKSSGHNILHDILEATYARVAFAKKHSPITVVASPTSKVNCSSNLLHTLSRNDFSVIAEIKYASPTNGSFGKEGRPPDEIAKQYVENGAAAISIVTEPNYFKGSSKDLRIVKQSGVSLPILRKDFIVDLYQLDEAFVLGADAVLLIVRVLGARELKRHIERCEELNLTPLVEVHTLEEAKKALECGAKVIGVNNRNLDTMEVTLKASEEIIKILPSDSICISESGIRHKYQVDHLKSLGFRGILVGSHLMQNANPGNALARLLGEEDES